MAQKQTQTKKISAEIYQYDKTLQRIYNVINKELSKQNAKLIFDYDKSMTRQSISKAARRIHVQALLNLSRFMQKDWKDVTKQDIEELVFKIMDRYADERGQETWTSADLKKVLKIFFRWYKLGSRDFKEVGDPPETKGVKIRPVRDTISREELITESDLTRLLHACGENARDRAFIDCHSEAGTRPGEILNLQIKHVKFDKYGATLHVDGKTGTRTIRLIRAVPNLAQWLSVHPFKENPQSPLWIMLKKEKFGKPLTYSAALKMVKIRCGKAGLTKRVNLKLFRHTEATETAKYMTEAQMRKRHGWTSYSKMPGRYVHLINADVEEAVLSHYGIVKTEDKENRGMPKKCHVCEMPNSPESKTCSRCGRPLDLSVALEIEEDEKIGKKQLEDKIQQLEQKQNEFEKDKLNLDKLVPVLVDEIIKRTKLKMKKDEFLHKIS